MCVHRIVMCCLFKFHVVIARVGLQHNLLAVFYASSPGEIHSGWVGKPGAGQKIFCPGAEAEQPKHEGIVWSIHGEYCFAWIKSGREREREGERINRNSQTFFVTVVCQGWGWPLSMSSKTPLVCGCFFGESRAGALRQVSSLLTQMVNSSFGKAYPVELFILVIIPIWWDFMLRTCINKVVKE